MSEWVRFRQPEDARDMVGCEVEGCDENARWRREGPHRCHAHVPSKQPEVKVTEVVGRLEMWERKGGGTASAIASPVGVAGPVKFLETLLPESAHSKWDGATMYGPYGRFRITVEFTPEEA